MMSEDGHLPQGRTNIITLVNPLCPINDQVLFSLKNLTPGLNTQFKRKDNKSVK